MGNDAIEGFRLSPTQKKLWLTQKETDAVYNTQAVVRLSGEIDVERLSSALNNLVSANEILRTTYQCLPGTTIPVMVISETESITINQHDLTDSPEVSDKKLAALIEKSLQYDFNLEKSPLLQVSLVLVNDNDSRLIVTVPALCSDNTGMNNMLHELFRFYESGQGVEDLDEESMQYADLAEWQIEVLEDEEAEEGISYWKEKDVLSGLTVDLPMEQRLAQDPGFAPAVHQITLDADLNKAIDDLCNNCSIQPSTFFYTCWQVLISRLSGQGKFYIGIGCNGRTYDELADAQGLLARFLPGKVSIESDSIFRDMLSRVESEVNENSEYQEYFTWEHFTEHHDAGASQYYFPVNFDYFTLPDSFNSGSLQISIEQQTACTERFNLKLHCIQSQNGYGVELHYNSRRFTVESITHLAEQMQLLLANAVAETDAEVGSLEFITEQERHKILNEFNQTHSEQPEQSLIHELIESSAANNPDDIAVSSDNGKLTYAELEKRSNQLARYLQKQGVAADVLVGLCTERSIEMIIGIVGILKAGGAYVPIDPSYPIERQSFILQDTKTPVLLTQDKLVRQLPEHNASVVCLDTDWNKIAKEDETRLDASGLTPGNLAYIIYTSGSTGKPKGVLISHSNLVHSTNARLQYYPDKVSGFLLLSSFAFDSSIAGIFWTLTQGGRLVLPGEGLERDVSRIVELIRANSISHVLGLPSLYSLILTESNEDSLSSLKAVCVAGEECPRQLLKDHFEKLPEVQLYNEYGPTEGTVWSSVYHCKLEDVDRQIPIGKPINNVQIYILNKSMCPVPIGVPGELHIGGAGVAQGYLNRPELSEEKFVTNPFSTPGAPLLYKTGDLARFRNDGNIEFLGRIDHQVKIRGYRIELGEIEAVLRDHPSVNEVVVLAREDQPGEKRVVAYIESHHHSPATINDLRDYLYSKVPDYMVPSAFVMMDALPLMPNGKINRKALPEPGHERPDLGTDFEAPRTPVESIVAQIWADLLGMEEISIHDNFFELGGHSIMATRLISKIRETFQVEVPLHMLFDAPTVAGFVEQLLSDLENKLIIEKTADILVQLDSMTDDEVEEFLEEKSSSTTQVRD